MTAPHPTPMQAILSGPRGEPLRFISLAELGQAPDNTETRQAAIRRLLRALKRELGACVTLEVAAEDVRTFHTMQAANQLSRVEATVQRYREEVEVAIQQYLSAFHPHPSSERKAG